MTMKFTLGCQSNKHAFCIKRYKACFNILKCLISDDFKFFKDFIQIMPNFYFEYIFSNSITASTLVTYMLMKENTTGFKFVQMIHLIFFRSLFKFFMEHNCKNNYFVNVNFFFIIYKNGCLVASIATKVAVQFDKPFDMF